MLASDDIHLGLCFSTNSLWSTRYFKVLPNVGRVKSSVDDLTMERGTVSMRVAFVLRSAEVQPTFLDLCGRERSGRAAFDGNVHSFLSSKTRGRAVVVLC